MRAYAILDGGGVKGAALAGCLKAAEEHGVTFEGYGGTSAGSIVALLACVGYTPDELHAIMVNKVSFQNFLDDQGAALERIRRLPAGNLSWSAWLGFLWKNRDLLSRMRSDLGLYHARSLQEFLLKKIRKRLRTLQHQSDITFADLVDAGRPPLKIVASDVQLRRPQVYSARGGEERNGSVIDAVRASMSYPFIFRPVRVNERYLVDGGLSSNLPVFLFEKERRSDGLPVVAFDLLPARPVAEGEYGLARYCGDLLSTALEASELLLRRLTEDLYYVPIPVPPDIGTLDFAISRSQREALFAAGHSAASSYFATNLGQWKQAATAVEQLQARHRLLPELVVSVLRALVREIETGTPARSLRANIMLPTGWGTRIVVYQVGMDNDPDVDLELGLGGGCSGRAWSTRRPAFADLVEARTTFASWEMTQSQQNKVRSDRTVMFSVPMFDARRAKPGVRTVEDLDVIGVLSLDTSTPLPDTEWRSTREQYVFEVTRRWADILAWMLM